MELLIHVITAGTMFQQGWHGESFRVTEVLGGWQARLPHVDGDGLSPVFADWRDLDRWLMA